MSLMATLKELGVVRPEHFLIARVTYTEHVLVVWRLKAWKVPEGRLRCHIRVGFRRVAALRPSWVPEGPGVAS